MFTIKATQRKTQLTLKLQGALTVYSVADSIEQFRDIKNFRQKVVCDLSELNELDTAGLQVLISLAKTTTAQGGEIALSKMNQSISELIELFALSKTFDLKET